MGWPKRLHLPQVRLAMALDIDTEEHLIMAKMIPAKIKKRKVMEMPGKKKKRKAD
jgi:hypothetical protein